MNRTSRTVLVIPLLVAGVVAVSFSAILIKWSYAPSAVIGMYRLLMTDALLLPFLLAQLPSLRPIGRKDALLVLASGTALGLHFLFWIASLSDTSVASSTVLLTLEPVFVMAGAYWWFRDLPRKPALWCLLPALIGTAAIGWGDFRLSAQALRGDALSLLGAIAMSVYMLIGQSLRPRMNALVYSFWTFLVAGLLLGIANVVSRTPLTGYGGREWLLFALLAVIPTIGGHFLFNWLLKYVKAATIAFTILGEPVGATLLAYVLLNQSLAPLQWAAGIVLIAAIAIFLRYDRMDARSSATGGRPDSYKARSKESS